MALSVDHKPNREDEYARIEAAGGKVIQWNGHRVFGVLAMSRSIALIVATKAQTLINDLQFEPSFFSNHHLSDPGWFQLSNYDLPLAEDFKTKQESLGTFCILVLGRCSFDDDLYLFHFILLKDCFVVRRELILSLLLCNSLYTCD
ncbi:hypothetical protein H5410_041710 [Solanum commersonii]|uniref:PPM-type phosphatase domain-containing protein n=1 Tax=Solanum commersonii TaxID=4109 RepID=A0A9J5XVC9_SOLCO|nr:hypothetical protein H5410_041710 [Solanum commersonii]